MTFCCTNVVLVCILLHCNAIVQYMHLMCTHVYKYIDIHIYMHLASIMLCVQYAHDSKLAVVVRVNLSCSSISNTAALAVANAIADSGCGKVQSILTSKVLQCAMQGQSLPWSLLLAPCPDVNTPEHSHVYVRVTSRQRADFCLKNQENDFV